MGPVRQVGVEPSRASGTLAAPLAAAATLTGGRWPAARSTATPCPFCTTMTVMANGMTSSMVAAQENAGMVSTGAAMMPLSSAPSSRRPESSATAVPTPAANATGGAILPIAGTAVRATNTRIIGRAIRGSASDASTSSRPNRRKMPATMAMTICGGSASITRATRPVQPSRNTRTPVSTYAPRTSANASWDSASPAMTVPGMVQKYACGERYHQLRKMVSRPLPRNTPKIHEDTSSSPRLPCAAAARMTATGPEAAKSSATKALPTEVAVMSARISRGPGRVFVGGSSASPGRRAVRVVMNPPWGFVSCVTKYGRCSGFGNVCDMRTCGQGPRPARRHAEGRRAPGEEEGARGSSASVPAGRR